MRSTLVLLFVDLASAPALFVTLVPAQRAQEQARTSPVGWWGARTPLGVQGQAQESRGPDSGTPPSLFLFYQVLPICKCWASPAETHTGTHTDTCELTFQKNPKMHLGCSNQYKRKRALLNTFKQYQVQSKKQQQIIHATTH